MTLLAAFLPAAPCALTHSFLPSSTTSSSRARRPRLSRRPLPARPSPVVRLVPSATASMSAGTQPLHHHDTNCSPSPPPKQPTFARVLTTLTNLFPLYTVAVAGVALRNPASFLWFSTPFFSASLGVLMLSMGVTLSPADFRRVLRRFNAVAVGFLCCYGIMPALAFALATLFKLPADLAAGTILVGALNGGQSSNLCTYIAGGNVALSVTMTTATTLGAMAFTPLIAKLFIGTAVPVNAAGIALSTAQVVLIPIAAGMLLNRFCPRVVRSITPLTPLIGIIVTCLLVGSSVAQCAPAILAAGFALQAPIILLHLLGAAAGYGMQALAGYGEVVRRTTAIETSMKSSAFGFLLASLHFSNPGVAVPSAVSVVWTALCGSVLSVIWRYVPVTVKKTKFDRSVAERSRPLDTLLNPAKDGK